MHEAGLDMTFVQDNQSMSKKGVLRGLYFQKKHPQGKLVRVIRGRVFDVAVDLRSGERDVREMVRRGVVCLNKKQFYIPQGFAHGFLVLSDEAEFCYKPICTIPKTKAASHGTIPRSASSGRSWSDGMTERRRGKIMPSKTGQRSLCRKKICAGAVWKSTEALRKAIAI